MSCSFDAVSGDPIALVRVQIGDTDCDNAAFTDEEIRLFLQLSGGNPSSAAATAATAQCAKFADCVDISIDDISEKNSQRAKQWCDLAKQLCAKCDKESAAPLPFRSPPGVCARPHVFDIGMNSKTPLTRHRHSCQTCALEGPCGCVEPPEPCDDGC